MTKYVLDANVFIEAKNRYYGMDFCPAFWEWLLEKHRADQAFSIKSVHDELTQEATNEEDEDDLSKWVKADGSCLFLPHDPKMVGQFPTVATWANGQSYTASAVSTFLGCADMYIVAHALAHSRTVVTHEKTSISVKKLKVPDACNGLGVKCVTLFDMLRTEGAKFVLAK